MTRRSCPRGAARQISPRRHDLGESYSFGTADASFDELVDSETKILIQNAVALLVHAQEGRVDYDVAADGAVKLLLKTLFLLELAS